MSRSLQEKRNLALLLGAAIILTTLPYLIGYALQTPDLTFSGFVMGIEDGNSYLAKMISGQTGNWLFRTPYSTFPQQGILSYLPYLLLGKLAGGDDLHIQVVNLFQFFRISGLIVYGIGLYLFLSQLVQKPFLRLAGVFLGIFGGGLGWIFLFPGLNGWYDYLPLDYYSPETFGFLSVLLYPHNAFARGLMLVGLAVFLKAELGEETRSRWQSYAISGGCLALAGFFQPLNAAIGAMVYGLTLLVKMIRTRKLRIHWKAVWLGIAPGLAWVVYLGVLGLVEPFFKEWTRQNLLFSPSFLQYLIAYGVIFFCVLLKYRELRIATNMSRNIIIITWIALLPILAYLPTGLQRRLPEGMWCAVIAIFLIVIESLPDSKSRKWINVVGAISILSPVSILVTILFGLVNHAPMQFIDTQKTALYHQMQTLPSGRVVISSYKTGNEIPAWTPLRVVQGLGPETIHNQAVYAEVNSFFQSDTTDPQRLKLLEEYQVDYVFYGPDEQTLGGWSPVGNPCAKSVMSNGVYGLFTMDHECMK